MINAYTMRKMGAIALCTTLPTVFFTIAVMYYGIFYAIGAFIFSMVLSYIISNVLLKNPFSMMLEGKGILALDLSSTGIIQPFIVSVDMPFIRGQVNNKVIEDVFDREAVYNLATPRKAEVPAKIKDGKIHIELNQEDYTDSRFALSHFPTLIYNSHINSLVTKEFLSDKEKSTFADHSILYANHSIRKLSDEIKPFSRYVVDTTKPKTNIFSRWWVWVIILIFVAIFAAMILPKIFPTIGTALSSVTGSLQTVTPTGG